MAMAGTEGRWSNVAALFVTLLFHIVTEIYALQNANDSKIQNEAGPWFVSSGGLLLLGASSLLLLLGVVILSGKLMRDYVSPIVNKILSKDVAKEGDSWKRFRNEVMKSWVAVCVWKTWYFIWNSLCSPGAGMLITICVVVMGAKVGCRSFFLHCNDERGNLTFFLQCKFILVEWILMLYRWFEAALYCAISLEKEHSEREDLLKFVDCPDKIIVDPLNVFGRVNIRVREQIIICEGDMGKVIRKLKQGLGTSQEEKRPGVERELPTEERARVDIQLRKFKALLEQSAETVSNSLSIRLGECSYSNLEELGEMLCTLVGHVIVSGLLEARDSALLENLVEDGDILFTTF
ncbi:hypothetical protein SUGI_0238640 [Cryptomeria japonica]|nr:hypothetical protein SUGI_0238640 [Cryptomeria japonica]